MLFYMIFLLVSFSSGLCFKDLSISPFHLVYCCVTFATMMLMSEDDIYTRTEQTYPIFVISFTQAGFSMTKFYTQKYTKIHKNTPKTVKYIVFRVQSGKFYT